MARYQCGICGYIFDEDAEEKEFSDLEKCPVCGGSMDKFRLVEESGGQEAVPEPARPETAAPEAEESQDLSYPTEYRRMDGSVRYMDQIHEMAVTGQPIIEAMGTRMSMPGWDDILLLGAQLNPLPLDEHAFVDTTTVIWPNAKKPLVLSNPVYISHMSFGALSKEAKVSLAKGSALAHTAMCSGEGGILPEEREAAEKYIFEYVPNLYSVTTENLRRADAVEIKIGQGTKPGMGGHLPGGKVTPEIAALRNKPLGEDVISPSRFPGASPRLVRDSTSVPTVFALYRARKYLDSVKSDISLVITGGLRVSSDFAKALAMGADAVAVASGALMAAACQQYRICGTGKCPIGMATQDETLRARLKVDAAAARVANYLNCSLAELKTFARITGHQRLHDLNTGDLCTISREISEFTNIPHA